MRQLALLFDRLPYAADRAEQAHEQMAATYHVLDILWPDGQVGLLLYPSVFGEVKQQPHVATLPYLRAGRESAHQRGSPVNRTTGGVHRDQRLKQSLLEVMEC